MLPMQHDMPTTLRNHQMKATPQRLAIAEIFFSKAQHLSAKQLKEQLHKRFPTLSLNTVYLTLQQFSKAGLLNEVITPERILFDSNTTPHDHAECENCGTLIDIESTQQQAPKSLTDWQLTHVNCIWRGICPQCKASNKH